MSKLSNWLISLADRWARWRQRRGWPVEPRVEIGPIGPRVEYVKPEPTDDYGWDRTHYERGNVHFQGIYNPIEVRARDTDESEVKLLPSQNYKAAVVANEIIPKAMNPQPFDKIKKIVMAGAAISGLTLIALLGFMAAA